MTKRKALTGWVEGKRVWFTNTFDGYRYASRYGTSGVLLSGDTDAHQRRHVRFATPDGEECSDVWVPQAHLRLTPPPGMNNATERAKEPRPPRRKEAIVGGTELTIFDVLEA